MKTYHPFYSFSWEGDWRAEDKLVVYAGAVRTAARLARYTGGNPCSTFDTVFDVGVFRASYSIQKGLHGFCYPNGVMVFRPGKVTQQLVVHELGHALDVRLIGSPLRPSTLLTQAALPLAGGRLAEHPPTMEGGNLPTERFAEIFLNWVYRSFVDNAAGRALEAWMDQVIIQALNNRLLH